MLTLCHPASGELRARGVKSCTNEVLHGWLKEELAQVVAALPPPAALSMEESRELSLVLPRLESAGVTVLWASLPGP